MRDRISSIKIEYVYILLLFFIWKAITLLASSFAVDLLPLGYTDRFLGGGFLNYSVAPEFFGLANFDGEHYLSIAIFGYKGLEQAFFPLYPMLISLLSKPFSSDLLSLIVNSIVAGIIISNLAFLFSLIYLYKLLVVDFSKKIAFLTICLVIIFPTSFYFGAVYNESLFLLLTVLAFISARKGNWFVASLFGMLASTTRIFGIFLLPAFLLEAYIGKKYKGLFWVCLIPLGLGLYMYYQYLTVGDPLAFYNLQDLVGEQRQSSLVSLPQVYFRYIKMLATFVNYNPINQTILFELVVGILFLVLPIYGYFKKIRGSYLLYAFMVFIITTVQGSFSSLPRYCIVFFPSFIALAILVDQFPKLVKMVLACSLILLLMFETAFFMRGYWVA